MWNHAVKFAGLRVGKRIAGLGTTSEREREQVIGHHNKVQAQLSHLRRAAPELDL